MGVGSPDCLVEGGCSGGVDMFDCVWPTRLARHGMVLTEQGEYGHSQSAFSRDYEPIEEGCACYACRKFSRAYIRHLLKRTKFGNSPDNYP